MSVPVQERTVSETATLRITRSPVPWRDRFRSYRVLVDGAAVGTIRNGQTADFSVPAGEHDVRLKLDWTGSKPSNFDVGVGEVAHFECKPAGSSLTSFFDVLAALGEHKRPWIALHQVPNEVAPLGDLTPGPGWWLAVDGKWYPPSPPGETPPSSPAFAPPPYHQHQQLPPASTNGFAIASLVLGIVWVGGVGSVLALIFGSVGKNQIESSGGRQAGRRIAVAGTVLGWVGVAILAVLIALAVVTSRNPTRATPSPKRTVPSVAAASRAYLSLITPVNSAAATFVSEAAGWNSQTTDFQLASEAQPVISTLQRFRQQLLSGPWPVSAEQDVTTLGSKVAPVVGDLERLSSLSLADASSWEATFGRDSTILRAADNAVRHDLGLPPASSGGGKSTGPSTPTPAGPSTPTSPAGTTSHPAASGTTPGGGSGSGSCFGCVTITQVTWAFWPGPDIPSEYQNCVSANSTVASNTQVVGPQVTNPTRDFTYYVRYTNGCTAADGIQFTTGKVELQGADPPISVVSTDPSVPFGVTPGASQELAVTFHALDGNYYDGPLVIDVIID